MLIPTRSELVLVDCDLGLVIAATEKDIQDEWKARRKECQEEDHVKALELGHEAIKSTNPRHTRNLRDHVVSTTE
jgi:polyribonucleotide nucleotidyltransferase